MIFLLHGEKCSAGGDSDFLLQEGGYGTFPPPCPRVHVMVKTVKFYTPEILENVRCSFRFLQKLT